jgi:hypothetical protein
MVVDDLLGLLDGKVATRIANPEVMQSFMKSGGLK